MKTQASTPSAPRFSVLKAELRKAFLSRWFVAATLMACGVAVLAGYEALTVFSSAGFDPRDATSYSFPSSWSCFSAWIGVGAWGHEGAYSLFFYGIVFIAPLAYSWSSVAEASSGYAGEVLVRSSRSAYYFSKLTAAFCSSAAVTALALLANLAFVACFFPGYLPDVYDELYTTMHDSTLFASLFYGNPAAFVLCRTAFDAVLCGAWSALILSLGWFVRNRVATFVIPYLVLLLLEYVNHYFFVAVFGPVYLFEMSVFQILQAWSFTYAQSALVNGVVTVAIAGLALLLTWRATKRDVL